MPVAPPPASSPLRRRGLLRRQVRLLGVLLLLLLVGQRTRANDDDERLPRLLASLQTADSFKVRATSAVALGRLGDARAAPALASALLTDEHYAVRVAAANALSRIPAKEAVPALLAATHDGDPFVREEATTSLEHFHTPELVDAFRGALTSEDPRLRLQAIRAYGDVVRGGDKDAAAVVVAALGDDDDAVQKEAQRALASMPHERALPVLLDGLAHGNPEARSACAELLGKRTDASAAEALLAALTDTAQLDDLHDAVRRAVKAHAAYYDVDGAAKSAVDTKPDAKNARITSLRLLGALQDGRVVPLLSRALDDGDASVRVAAARASVDLGGEAGKKLLDGARQHERDPRMQQQIDLLRKTVK